MRQHRLDNLPRYQRAARLSFVLRRYGLDAATYDQMIVDQQGSCAVCRAPFKPAVSPHVDHCHTTGAVRGLLCGGCNTGLGSFLDNPTALRSAADYIESFRG
jgi:hypothetical protein